ncbi:hypothetical protein WKH31_13330 [Metabacillus indicus]
MDLFEEGMTVFFKRRQVIRLRSGKESAPSIDKSIVCFIFGAKG